MSIFFGAVQVAVPAFSLEILCKKGGRTPKRKPAPSFLTEGCLMLATATAVVATSATVVVSALATATKAVAAAEEQNQQDDDPNAAAVSTKKTIVTHKRFLLDLGFNIVYGGTQKVVTQNFKIFFRVV